MNHKTLENRLIQAGLAECGYKPVAGQGIHAGCHLIVRHPWKAHFFKKPVQERYVDKLLVSQGRGIEEKVGVDNATCEEMILVDGVTTQSCFYKGWALYVVRDIGLVEDRYLLQVFNVVGALLVVLEKGDILIQAWVAARLLPWRGSSREHRD